jgi:hypothetical protein
MGESTETAASACTGTLEHSHQIFPCPASYAAATDGPNQLCRDYEDRFQVSSRDAHSFINYLFGTGWVDCVYDASSSALVGMLASSDGGDGFCAGDLGEADRAPQAAFHRVDCRDSDLPPPVGSASPLPRACPGGRAPAFLVQTGTGVLGSFAVGASDVYWSEPSSVWHVPKAGGTALPVIEGDAPSRVLGSDAEALYWSRRPVWSSPPALYRLLLESGAEPLRIADDASDAWTVSRSQIYYLSSGGQLRAVPTAGGASTLLADGPWSSQALAADATGIYWYADPPSAAAEPLSKYTFATGSVTAFAPVTGGARFVQSAGGRVLWADAAGVWSSTSSGERTSLSSATSVRGLACDGTQVYWAQSGGPEDVFSDILRQPLAGGAAQTIACHVYAVRSLRADGAAVYYDSTVSDVVGKISLD